MSERIEVQKHTKPTLADRFQEANQGITIKFLTAKVIFWQMHAVAPEKISEMPF